MAFSQTFPRAVAGRLPLLLAIMGCQAVAPEEEIVRVPCHEGNGWLSGLAVEGSRVVLACADEDGSFLEVSEDAGESFAETPVLPDHPDRQVGDGTLDEGSIALGTHGATYFVSGAFWSDDDPLTLWGSTDGGQTWTEGRGLSSGRTGDMLLRARGDREVVVAWTDNSEDDQESLSVARSSDGGATLDLSTELTRAGAGEDVELTSLCLAGADTIAVAWTVWHLNDLSDQAPTVAVGDGREFELIPMPAGSISFVGCHEDGRVAVVWREDRGCLSTSGILEGALGETTVIEEFDELEFYPHLHLSDDTSLITWSESFGSEMGFTVLDHDLVRRGRPVQAPDFDGDGNPDVRVRSCAGGGGDMAILSRGEHDPDAHAPVAVNLSLLSSLGTATATRSFGALDLWDSWMVCDDDHRLHLAWTLYDGESVFTPGYRRLRIGPE